MASGITFGLEPMGLRASGGGWAGGVDWVCGQQRAPPEVGHFERVELRALVDFWGLGFALLARTQAVEATVLEVNVLKSGADLEVDVPGRRGSNVRPSEQAGKARL
jgi:hypothetical protein